MPLRSDWSDALCPIRRTLDVIGDPWVLLIVRDVLHGRGRFDQLRDNLGISEAVLSRRLRAMVDGGLLTRVEYEAGGRVRRGYAATASAAELLPVFQYLVAWGERHTPMPAGGAHMAMIHEPCGAETGPGSNCTACGEALAPEDVAWIKPWQAEPYDALIAAGVLATP